MIRIAIVEDEEVYSRQLEEYLNTFMRESGETISYRVFRNGEQLLFDYQPDYDILLMDVEMPGMDGITAARKVREQDQEVIILFITNMAQYALQGYTVQARSYLLKPVNYYGFAMELQGAIDTLAKRRTSALLVLGEDGLQKVRIGDILYIESRKHDLFIHTAAGVIRIRESMRNMEARLEGYYFVRCNVSYLVNLVYVNGIREDDVIVGQERLPVSRQKRKAFIRALSLYIGGSQIA